MLHGDQGEVIVNGIRHLKQGRMVIDKSINPHCIFKDSAKIHHVHHGGQGEGGHGEWGLRFRKKSIWADNFPFAPTY
jgi:hypothetical protein